MCNGHYVSYFRYMELTCDLDDWYIFDDSTVKKVTYREVKDVAESNAYQLLYVSNVSYRFMESDITFSESNHNTTSKTYKFSSTMDTFSYQYNLTLGMKNGDALPCLYSEKEEGNCYEGYICI